MEPGLLLLEIVAWDYGPVCRSCETTSAINVQKLALVAILVYKNTKIAVLSNTESKLQVPSFPVFLQQ